MRDMPNITDYALKRSTSVELDSGDGKKENKLGRDCSVMITDLDDSNQIGHVFHRKCY